jgi:arginine decarboxylase
MDTWNELQVLCTWLNEYARAGREIDQPRTLVGEHLDVLASLEQYWAFPGRKRLEQVVRMFERNELGDLSSGVAEIARRLVGDAYRERGGATQDRAEAERGRDVDRAASSARFRAYFEVLFVDGIDAFDQSELRDGLAACRRDSDEFVYDVVTVPSLEDAIIAVLFNPTIQAVFLRYNYAFQSRNRHPALRRYLDVLETEKLPISFGLERSVALGRVI